MQKSTFDSKSIKVLGSVVSKNGIQPEPGHNSAVLNVPRRLQQKGLHSFLGLAPYFRRFIQTLATIASPLHHLLYSCIAFAWN